MGDLEEVLFSPIWVVVMEVLIRSFVRGGESQREAGLAEIIKKESKHSAGRGNEMENDKDVCRYAFCKDLQQEEEEAWFSIWFLCRASVFCFCSFACCQVIYKS